jgi:hypothetical protein
VDPTKLDRHGTKLKQPILTTQEEWDKRWKLAVEILTTGKAAAEKPEKETADKPKEPATKEGE